MWNPHLYLLYALLLDPGCCLRAHTVLIEPVEPVEPEGGEKNYSAYATCFAGKVRSSAVYLGDFPR